jgi:ADP-ribose pyrophosphatase YjhB (NUDIX family)
MSAIWTPHFTVAAVIEQEGRFLMVEENADGRIVFNQPAGHVEEDETAIEAVRRETLEESGRHFTPESIVGIYRWRNPHNHITYLRVAYCGRFSSRDRDLSLDTDIITTHWLSYAELEEKAARLRSPLVMRCIDDYLTGKRLPLDLINEIN